VADLGVLVPIAVALIVSNGLSPTAVCSPVSAGRLSIHGPSTGVSQLDAIRPVSAT
jgi:hypothetical protein